VTAAGLEGALSELRDSSEALWVAMRSGEIEQLVEALARRESAHCKVVRAAGPLSAGARALLAEVQRGDREALGAAATRLAGLRHELEEVREARAALARMRKSEQPARFLSRRV
jgi:hypothetical protein